MDIKTLEYMEERAKKAREIVNLIEKLNKNIKELHRVVSVRFFQSGNYELFSSLSGSLTYDLIKAYEDVAKNKIDQLEKELAEL